jgi:hypothetical protein
MRPTSESSPFVKVFALAGAMAVAPAAHCQIVGFSGDGFDTSNPLVASALASLPGSFTQIARDGLAGAASAGGYSVLWLDGFSTFPNFPTTELTSFVDNGGILLVQSPGLGGNPLSAYPFGSELSGLTFAPSAGFPAGEPAVHIVNSANPIMAGLTDAGLTWQSANAWNASGHAGPSIGSFQGLADNGTAGQWITLARPAGAGEVIYTYQDISRRLADPLNGAQPLKLLNNIIAAPEPPTAALAAAGAALLLASRHRRR